MKRMRTFWLYLLVTVMIVVLSACGQSDNTDNASGNAGNAGNGGQKQVELSFMTTWSESDPFTGVYYKNAMAFEKANPDIKLDIETIPYNDYPVKLNTTAAGGNLPDLILMIGGGSMFEQIARSGSLMPIDDMMGNWKEDFLPASKIKEFNVDGKQYGIPGEISYATVIYYNKKIMKDAGYTEFPKTYEAFKAMVKDLKAKNITPISYGNKTGSVLLASLLSPLNERISGSGLYEEIKSGKQKFTDTEFMTALKDIKELSDMGAFNVDLNSIDNVQATNLFLSGKSAMYIDGSWGAKQISKDKAADFEVGFALFPQIEGGKGSMSAMPAATNQGVVLNAKLDDAKKAAAEKFLQFMYSKESYQNIIRDGNMVPANVETPADVDPLFKEMTGTFAGIKEIAPVYDVAMPATVVTATKNGLQGLTTPGGTTPEAVADSLQKELGQ
ncbi:raffinose/stachyose/melibiose transport system substrate-binding protein [Paenibacillus forsythiae]|uniref:Raffinose/stachyose/melibiose transport system substrate-binding protein n=1 Tax=Paenibacillus forsythiae TaxID=365616 RepID=A0ABU3H5B2_9BACL|nr:extracellular solute-binding protein [Paenibacillus forsythiae]MDT3426007.1 raffinose/stachyose/melibiose transport system substrate-binding protein [Paenibacillus forsythiae]